MRTIKLIISIIFFAFTCKSQRYLTNQFTQVDSIVNIVYGNANNYLSVPQQLMLDFYQPNGDVLNKRPLIIYIHGGGFTSGTRKYLHIKNILSRMVLKGYVAASIDYRLDPSFVLYNSTTNRREMTDAMHDAKAAIRFFKANATTYGIDTNQIIIGGESAGAITAMMAAYVDKQSEMSVYPMSNPNDPTGNSGNSGYSNKTKATLCLCGLILDTSAIEIMDNPVLVVHGTADPMIPLMFPQNIVSRAQHTFTDYTKYFFNGATHCPWITTLPNFSLYEDSTVTLITNFLYQKIIAGISQNKTINNMVKVYPNPSNGVISIENLSSAQPISVDVLDILGSKIHTDTIQIKETKQISLTHLDKGIYILHLKTNTNTITQKIIIE